ncbi:MAG: helix-turn-helix domain-containing protein [Aristaeellaceae bacterium]
MWKRRRAAGGRWGVRFRRVYLVFFASYLVMLMLPLAGILYLYNQVMDVTEKNCARSALTAISDTASSMRSRLLWMDGAASRFLLDSQMTSMMYAEPLSYGDKRINTFTAFSDHLNDLIGIYDKESLGFRMLFQDSELVFYDDVISHGLEFVFDNALRYEGMTYEEWYEAVFSPNVRTLLPAHDIFLGGTRVRALTYNYPILRRSASGNRKAVLQFFIQEKSLYPQGFHPLSTGYLLDAQGNLLADFGAREPFPLAQATLPEGVDWLRLDRGLMVMTEVRDGIQLAMLIPDEVAFRDVYAMHWPMILVFMLCAVLEGVLMLYLAKRNARPIEHMASDMTRVLDMPRQGNELEFIHQGILQLQQNQLSAMQHSLRMETALLLNRLMNQRTDDVEVLLKSGERIGIDLRAAGYCAAIIQLPAGAVPVRDAIMPEPPRQMRVIIGEGRRNRLNVLYLMDTEEAVENAGAIAGHMQQLHDQLPQGTRVGQGRVCAALDDVTFSFNQAMYCLQAEGVEAGIVSFDQISPGVNSLCFPLEQQQRIINAVKHNNTAVIDQEFELILNENTVRRHLSALMKRTLLSSIEALLLMAAEDVTRQDNLPDYLRSVQRTDDFRTQLEILRLEFHKIAEQVGGRFAQVSNQRAAMEDYLEKHYSDSMLSIGSMAEKFGFSESYFSVLFKDTLGEPYSSYLEKLRLNKAGELLTATDKSVEDIAQLVGYNNSTTFRRAFKRVKGLSPQQYRNQTGE